MTFIPVDIRHRIVNVVLRDLDLNFVSRHCLNVFINGGVYRIISLDESYKF